MISNDFKKEMENVGIKVSIKDDKISFEKDTEVIELEISKVRRIFVNSIVSYIDNTINK